MKYRDLIQFEPVTEVIQLVSANEKEKAAQLVNTYVISDRMADVLISRILPALKLGENAKSRGLFIVGNYGTGKSHLMSVLTSVAEHPDLLDHVKYPAVRKELEAIAGKFKISRQETTAKLIPLRDLVFAQLEDHLMKMGVGFAFPGEKDPTTNKQALVDMMAQFARIYPDQGLMIALDELLDFLRQKNEKEMITDLNFLREVGEVCEILPLRFMAGIQEALFDNPRFQFVADSVRRVKSRFDQAAIVREDIAYVVSHRLLAKTQEQKRIIRKHLENFTPLYSEMAERLDDYIDLFPVHPTYLEVFERVTIGERRELLTAISQEMNTLLDRDVPADQPGLITFDSYWRMISQDNAFRALPDVRNVLDKAQVLSEKVRRAPELKVYREASVKIIDGLALHRLTVSDIYTPIGITPSEIRDQLCIAIDIPEQDADFLLASIETILKSILKAVNGQFISHNKENDQYYLDLKKDIDYEALIQAKAEALDDSTIDRYYFELITHALEINTLTSYVPGFRIWESEIPWSGHGITRRGYLFLGAANERSTAHPERDYYIHFLSMHGNGYPDQAPKKDEVYYRFALNEKEFVERVRLYAGAAEMSAISSGSNKDQYEMKIRQERAELLTWLRENFLRCYRVKHMDEELPVTEAVARYRLALRDLTFRDQIYSLSGAVLAEAFAEKFPQYPSFGGVELTSATIISAAESALKALGGGPNIRLAQCVLEGLGLGHMDGSRMLWTIESSPYAAYFQKLVADLDARRVINRQDLITGEPGAERDVKFSLEPELLIVVLAALMRQGALSISVQGFQIAEADIQNGPRLSLEQLLRFTSISRPKPLPELAVKELFTQFGIAPEIVSDPAALALGVNQLQQNIQAELNRVILTFENLRDGPKFWQEIVLPPAEQQKARKQLDDYRIFLNGLQAYTTPARLANLSVGVGEIRAAVKTRTTLQDIQHIFDILNELRPAWDYLVQAQPLLPANEDWQVELKDARKTILETLADPAKRSAQNASAALKGRLENLQSSYAKRYLELHNDYRLDRGQDQVKSRLTGDPRWARMRALGKISLLPSQMLKKLQDEVGGIETCYHLQLVDLLRNIHCPHCSFNPSLAVTLNEKAVSRLERVQQEFDQLCTAWVETLLSNLQTEEAAHNLSLVSRDEREAVQTFIQSQTLPEPLTQRFLDGVENTLHGLEVLTVDGAEYLLALTQPGMPCTPDELERRIREFLQQRLAGKDRHKLRIQIDW